MTCKYFSGVKKYEALQSEQIKILVKCYTQWYWRILSFIRNTIGRAATSNVKNQFFRKKKIGSWNQKWRHGRYVHIAVSWCCKMTSLNSKC